MMFGPNRHIFQTFVPSCRTARLIRFQVSAALGALRAIIATRWSDISAAATGVFDPC